MAFEADCGSSTVLEALLVASTAKSPVPGRSRPTPPFPLLPCSFSRGMNAGSQRRRRDRFIAWGVSPRN